tara:strand:+ start:2036 stop:2257 length:222 start_codon:yes stop_codon:yes gene_type:complete
MKVTTKRILLGITPIIIAYISRGFISANFNCWEWTEGERVIVVTLGFWLGLVLATMPDCMLKNTKKKQYESRN